MNSDKFIFDRETIVQAVAAGFKIEEIAEEIAVPTRYFPEASQISFAANSIYGLRILSLLAKYGLHKTAIHRNRQFQSLGRRYDSRRAA
jgi:hypothetical protein